MNDINTNETEGTLAPVIDATDATLAPTGGEGEAAQQETTIFIAEDAEAV